MEDRRSRWPHRLLIGGVLAQPLFVVVFMFEGATRAGYDPVRLPVSLLSLGEGGWIQVLNFAVDGLLLLAFAVGLQSAFRQLGTPAALVPLLLAIFAIGILAAGLFSTDPGGGYPPGAPVPGEPSTHSLIHHAVSLMVFTILSFACFAFARRFGGSGDRRWASYSVATGVALVIGSVVLFAGFNGARDIGKVAGVIQRIWIVVGWGWLMLLGLHTLRSTRIRRVETIDPSA